MAERGNIDQSEEDLEKKRLEIKKGKAKVGEPSDEDDDQSTAADNSDVDSPSKKVRNTPSKKRRTESDETTQENVNEPRRFHHVQILNDTNNPARPGSRIVSIDKLRITKILNLCDVLPVNTRLIVDTLDASILADEPDFETYPSPKSYKKMILAYDEFDREFNLVLSVHLEQGNHDYKLTGGWGLFVNMHKLRAGDEIMFFKYKDDRVSNDYYYVLRYFKKPKPKGY